MVVLPVSECTSCLRLRMCVHFEVAKAEGQGEVLTVNIATQGIGAFGQVGARSQIGLYITSSVAPCECNFSCFFRSFVSSIFLCLYRSTLLLFFAWGTVLGEASRIFLWQGVSAIRKPRLCSIENMVPLLSVKTLPVGKGHSSLKHSS